MAWRHFAEPATPGVQVTAIKAAIAERTELTAKARPLLAAAAPNLGQVAAVKGRYDALGKLVAPTDPQEQFRVPAGRGEW